MQCTTRSGQKEPSWVTRASSTSWRKSSRENDHEGYAASGNLLTQRCVEYEREADAGLAELRRHHRLRLADVAGGEEVVSRGGRRLEESVGLIARERMRLLRPIYRRAG